MTNNIISLVLLRQIEEARRHAKAGELEGFSITMQIRGCPVPCVHLGGVYQDDPDAAIRAMLAASLELANPEPEPPKAAAGG